MLKDGSDYGVWIRYAVEGTPLGTGGAFKNAEEHIDSATVVFNGDVMTDIDLAAVVAHHGRGRGGCDYRPDPGRKSSAYGLVETNQDGWIQRFIEKPGPDEITCDTINAGIYVLEPSVLKYMPKGEPYSFERGLFPTFSNIKSRSCLYSRCIGSISGRRKNIWKSITTFLSGKFMSPRISHSALDRSSLAADVVVDQKSIIAPDVTIRRGVRIENCVIGKNCKIDEGVHLTDSVIWSGNTIDADARIARSLVERAAILAVLQFCGPGWFSEIKTVITDFSHL